MLDLWYKMAAVEKRIDLYLPVSQWTFGLIQGRINKLSKLSPVHATSDFWLSNGESEKQTTHFVNIIVYYDYEFMIMRIYAASSRIKREDCYSRWLGYTL